MGILTKIGEILTTRINNFENAFSSWCSTLPDDFEMITDVLLSPLYGNENFLLITGLLGIIAGAILIIILSSSIGAIFPTRGSVRKWAKDKNNKKHKNKDKKALKEIKKDVASALKSHDIKKKQGKIVLRQDTPTQMRAKLNEYLANSPIKKAKNKPEKEIPKNIAAAPVIVKPHLDNELEKENDGKTKTKKKEKKGKSKDKKKDTATVTPSLPKSKEPVATENKPIEPTKEIEIKAPILDAKSSVSNNLKPTDSKAKDSKSLSSVANMNKKEEDDDDDFDIDAFVREQELARMQQSETEKDMASSSSEDISPTKTIKENAPSTKPIAPIVAKPSEEIPYKESPFIVKNSLVKDEKEELIIQPSSIKESEQSEDKRFSTDINTSLTTEALDSNNDINDDDDDDDEDFDIDEYVKKQEEATQSKGEEQVLPTTIAEKKEISPVVAMPSANKPMKEIPTIVKNSLVEDDSEDTLVHSALIREMKTKEDSNNGKIDRKSRKEQKNMEKISTQATAPKIITPTIIEPRVITPAIIEPKVASPITPNSPEAPMEERQLEDATIAPSHIEPVAEPSTIIEPKEEVLSEEPKEDKEVSKSGKKEKKEKKKDKKNKDKKAAIATEPKVIIPTIIEPRVITPAIIEPRVASPIIPNSPEAPMEERQLENATIAPSHIEPVAEPYITTEPKEEVLSEEPKEDKEGSKSDKKEKKEKKKDKKTIEEGPTYYARKPSTDYPTNAVPSILRKEQTSPISQDKRRTDSKSEDKKDDTAKETDTKEAPNKQAKKSINNKKHAKPEQSTELKEQLQKQDAKANAEAIEIEKQAKAEAKIITDAEKKAKAEAKIIADAEKKAKAEAKIIADAEKKILPEKIVSIPVQNTAPRKQKETLEETQARREAQKAALAAKRSEERAKATAERRTAERAVALNKAQEGKTQAELEKEKAKAKREATFAARKTALSQEEEAKKALAAAKKLMAAASKAEADAKIIEAEAIKAKAEMEAKKLEEQKARERVKTTQKKIRLAIEEAKLLTLAEKKATEKLKLKKAEVKEAKALVKEAVFAETEAKEEAQKKKI